VAAVVVGDGCWSVSMLLTYVWQMTYADDVTYLRRSGRSGSL
jgi:hypothetical protein